MSDIQPTVLVIILGVSIFLILYIFSSFSYKISEKTLIMQWRILGYIPFSSREIKMENIQEARRFELKNDLWSGADIFGNLFKKGVILKLPGRFFFMKKIFITPDDPDRFIAEINRKKIELMVSQNK